MIKVIKRDGTLEDFNGDKIINGVEKAFNEVGEYWNDSNEASFFTEEIYMAVNNHYGEEVGVEELKDLIEGALMVFGFPKTAKAYILYRDKKERERKPDIFKKRLEFKPYEYPELAKYGEAIQHSYWLFSEFNYTSDIHDFKSGISEVERNAIKNAMLAISQVEVSVKSFWGDLYKRLPKPELGNVGAIFSESESRHSEAYSHLLEILGLNEEFNNIRNIPELMQRVEYLDNATATAHTLDDRDFVIAIILFSLFIEHVSLFSQFLVVMSFNKHQNLFKGMSNAIEATSKEEELHGQFGIDLVNTIRNEHPEWFDEDMKRRVIEACKHSWEAEDKVIDWIYEAGDLEFMPKHDVKEFVKNRLNNSLVSVGYDKMFEVDEDAVERTEWFNDELISTKHVDFFVKRSINYTKRAKSITGDDLF